MSADEQLDQLFRACGLDVDADEAAQQLFAEVGRFIATREATAATNARREGVKLLEAEIHNLANQGWSYSQAVDDAPDKVLAALDSHPEEAKSEYLTCSECGKSDDTVGERACGYSEEISGTEVMEVVCNDCEHEHLMDI